MRLLNLLGVAVGPEQDLLPPADADNPRGYWEPQWMIELNDEILARLGTVWQRPFPLGPGWERRAELDELRERAKGLLEEKFGATPLWGCKDPRLMLTLPFWRELIPDMRYVMCLRNPADVISSFQRRPEPNLTIEQWGDLWLEFNARALRETRGEPRLLVFYEDLFRSGREQLERMASFLGIEVPGDAESFWEPLLGEIEPGLRHHSTSAIELGGSGAIPPEARMLFLALRAGEDARSSAAPEKQGGTTVDAIERVIPDLWYERRLLAEARAAREQAAEQLAARDREQGELRAAAESARTELAALRQELGEAHQQLARASEQLSEAATAKLATDTELASLRNRLESQQRVMDGLQGSVSWRLTRPLRWFKRIFAGGKDEADGDAIESM